MKREVEPYIEALIARRLDGELAEPDRLTLDRELIRNPAARRMLESYQRIDRLAAAALQRAVGDARSTIDVKAFPPRTRAASRPSRRWVWQLATGAVAAALLAVLVARFATDAPRGDESMAENPRAVPSSPYLSGGQFPPQRPDLMRHVGAARPKIWRDTGREMLGVVGDDGNLYWIGIDRTHTARLNRSERM